MDGQGNHVDKPLTVVTERTTLRKGVDLGGRGQAPGGQGHAIKTRARHVGYDPCSTTPGVTVPQ
jgi:hypothetical protein